MIPFDIDTTGFERSDTVTTVRFELELGCRVFLQSDGRSADSVEAAARERMGRHVVVSIHSNRQTLLEAVRKFVAKRLWGEDVLLVEFNAETWNAGLDLPLLRSRHAANDVAWPFTGLPYADLMPVVTNRFNTTVDGGPKSDLEGVYAAMCDGDLNEMDPFLDSAEAVKAFDKGCFEALVAHNVTDVLRTGSLGAVSERYCSKSDYKLKSLTPTVNDT